MTIWPDYTDAKILLSGIGSLDFSSVACHIKNVDILGGTPTWDLDVPVHPIGQ